jgi:polyvinyl alcohol dehydrogenase (cytochrome)
VVARIVALFVFAFVCFPLVAEPPQASPGVGRRRALSAPTNDWPKYCASLSMNGVSQGERILASSSVPAMQLLWSRTLNGMIASAPSVVQGKVYVGDWGGYEWALDASTGDVIASVNLGLTKSENCNPDSLGISSSPLIQDGSVFLAGGDDAFYSLDADTLQINWRRPLGDNSAAGGYYGWCSPSMAGGKVLQGIASNCDDPFPRGAIAALDPATGEILQTTYFVPDDLVGAGVWTSPAVDTDHNKVFVTTGSSHSFADGDSFSIVRLDLDTMLIEDRWKLPATPGRTWDIDWGSSPVLFTDSAGRELVGAGQKDGGFYAFDRNDLAAGPIWTAPIAIGGEVPQIGQGTLSTPAFDGKRLFIGGGHPPEIVDDSLLGAVSAVSPDDGTILWRHMFDGPVIAPVAYANGLVFAVGGNSVIALDAASGDVLWSYQMKAPGFGGVAIARGRVYVGDLSKTIYAFGLR